VEFRFILGRFKACHDWNHVELEFNLHADILHLNHVIMSLHQLVVLFHVLMGFEFTSNMLLFNGKALTKIR